MSIELSRLVGRLDWWNIKTEHTPFQWAAQRAAHALFPTSDRRADLRSAYHTANLMVAMSHAEISDYEFNEMVQELSVYLKADEEHDADEPDLDALKRMKRNARNRRSRNDVGNQ